MNSSSAAEDAVNQDGLWSGSPSERKVYRIDDARHRKGGGVAKEILRTYPLHQNESIYVLFLETQKSIEENYRNTAELLARTGSQFARLHAELSSWQSATSIAPPAPQQVAAVESMSDPSTPIEFSTGLLLQILKHQKGGESVLEREKEAKMRGEVRDRILDSVADVGYRWIDRERGEGALAAGLDADIRDVDDEFAQILMFELHLALMHAPEVIESVIRELAAAMARGARLSGDWGELELDAGTLVLRTALER